MALSETDLAYFAGFFDGEGSVTIARAVTSYKGRVAHWVYVSVANTDRASLLSIQNAFGGAIASDRPRHAGERICYHWRASSKIACRFLLAIRPYVRLKADQVDLALEFQGTLSHRARTPEVVAERDAAKSKLLELKRAS